MAKNKKNKIIRLPQSLDAKIRTRGRNLKIGDCYISDEWEDAKEANIFISRAHSNGNLSIGVFLVDLALRGVKDAMYLFNVPQEHLSELLYDEEIDEEFIEIDYEIAHNIIYGAIDFAEQYGFKPCKEFAVAKYLLEEDDENIPLIDIEFGIDGIPTIICNDDEPKLDEVKHMEKVVGVGNFNVLNTDYFDDDDNIDSLLNDSLLPGWDDDIDEIGVPDWEDEEWENYFDNISENESFRTTQYFIDMLFLENYDLEIDAFEYVLGGAKYNDVIITDEINNEEGTAITVLLKLLTSDDSELISKESQKIADRFPMSVTINLLIALRNSEIKGVDDVYNEFEVLRKRFYDNILFLDTYAGWFVDNNLAENIPGLFNNKQSLKEFIPNKTFTAKEVIGFCSAYCSYYLAIGEIEKAEPYYQVLDTLADDNPRTRIIIQDLVFEKMNLVKNMNN